MSQDTSSEKYTSHFIWKGSKVLLKVLLGERWVGDWRELQHIEHHFYDHNSISFPFSWAAQPEAWGPSLSGTWSSFQHLLSNSSELQLINRGSWGPLLLGAGSLYSILSPTNSNFLCTEFYAHSIQPVDSQGYPFDTFDRIHLLFTQMHFLFWQLGRGKYATGWGQWQFLLWLALG